MWESLESPEEISKDFFLGREELDSSSRKVSPVRKRPPFHEKLSLPRLDPVLYSLKNSVSITLPSSSTFAIIRSC